MKKIKTALIKIEQLGFLGFIIFIFEEKFKIRLPLNSRLRWAYSKNCEINFWDSYFKTKGLQWSDSYHLRFDPNLELQPEVTKFLPINIKKICILDVGAGPLTYLGKVYKDFEINITAVDPLANDYNRILKKYNITPTVRTIKNSAEKLTRMFSEDTFDLVFARNCIDHSYSPEKAILKMIKVVKRNCYVLMIHHPNEAIKENYMGLHQWNFSMKEGDFLISSRFRDTNFSKKYKSICQIECLHRKANDGEWLYTIIKKK